MIQGGGHSRYKPMCDVHCRLPTDKYFFPARVRGQNVLFHHRFMGQEASSALASLVYRSSNFFKLTRCQSVKLVQTTQSLIPNSSSLQNLALQDQGLQLDNIIPLLVVCMGRS